MDALTLYDAIADVSPVNATAVGKPDDRATWTWTPGPNATQPQIDAGNNVVATIPIDTKAIALTTPEFIGRFTNAEYRAAMAAAWRGTAGNAKNWDVVVFQQTINMNKKATNTLKTSLVTDGILTAQRADEIFQ